VASSLHPSVPKTVFLGHLDPPPDQPGLLNQRLRFGGPWASYLCRLTLRISKRRAAARVSIQQPRRVARDLSGYVDGQAACLTPWPARGPPGLTRTYLTDVCHRVPRIPRNGAAVGVEEPIKRKADPRDDQEWRAARNEKTDKPLPFPLPFGIRSLGCVPESAESLSKGWRRRPDLNRGWRFCRPADAAAALVWTSLPPSALTRATAARGLEPGPPCARAS
jgi:hypothetical protein